MKPVLWGYLGLLIVYNVLAFYFDFTYLKWHWEAINNTVAFVFFGVLIDREEYFGIKAGEITRFLICCIMGSTVLSLLYHLTGYTALYICNHRIYQHLEPLTYESRNYWLYGHKSDYALMLVVFMAVVLRWHVSFFGKWRWFPWVGLILLAIALCQTHSWTGIAGGLLVIGSFVLDKVNWKAWKKWYFGPAALLAAAAGGILYKISQERDIFSLGSRLGIWEGVMAVIKKYPKGWGMRFGDSQFMTLNGWATNNAHNVFLNAVLRFSIPVGICFGLILIAIIIYTLVRAGRFLAVGMWGGMLMLMMMDYALNNYEMAMVLFCVFLVCICGNDRKKDGEHANQLN